MITLGIDPSSSCTGLAIVENNQLITVDNWKPSNKDGSTPSNLHAYFTDLCDYIDKHHPDMACVEFLSVTQNMNSVRVISHYQAASVLACKVMGVVVIEARVSQARKYALGKGNASKDEAWLLTKQLWPDMKFSAKTSGGMDEADAAVLALAGTHLAELRRR